MRCKTGFDPGGVTSPDSSTKRQPEFSLRLVGTFTRDFNHRPENKEVGGLNRILLGKFLYHSNFLLTLRYRGGWVAVQFRFVSSEIQGRIVRDVLVITREIVLWRIQV